MSKNETPAWFFYFIQAAMYERTQALLLCRNLNKMRPNKQKYIQTKPNHTKSLNKNPHLHSLMRGPQFFCITFECFCILARLLF